MVNKNCPSTRKVALNYKSTAGQGLSALFGFWCSRALTTLGRLSTIYCIPCKEGLYSTNLALTKRGPLAAHGWSGAESPCCQRAWHWSIPSKAVKALCRNAVCRLMPAFTVYWCFPRISSQSFFFANIQHPQSIQRAVYAFTACPQRAV